MTSDYYHDHRFCDACRKYVSYLQSLDTGYCVECGGAVKIFSPSDLIAFRKGIRYLEPTVA